MKTILYKIKLTTYNNKLKTTCKRRRIFKIELVKNLHKPAKSPRFYKVNKVS